MRVKRFFITLIPLIVVSINVASSLFSRFPMYLDEKYYIGCGLKYVSGVPPYLCNFEHPPFAKYLIGFFEFFGLGRVVFLFLWVLCCVFIYLIVCRFSRNCFVGFVVFLFVVFDTLFFNVFRFLLLDPVAVIFSLLSLYLFLESRYSLSAVSLGFAVASKFSSIPIALSIFLVFVFGKRFREIVRFFLVVFVVYLVTYVVDFTLGWDAVVKHHIDMFSYMSWRHGYSFPIAVNGFLKLLTKVEVWRFSGELNVVLSNVSGVYTIVNQSFVVFDVVKNYVVIGVGMGSPLWYLHFPLLLYNTYAVLVGKGSRGVKYAVLFSWLSLLNVVAGPIDWYYVNVLPFLYINTVFALENLLGKRFKHGAFLLVGVEVAMYILTVVGLVPFKIVVIV